MGNVVINDFEVVPNSGESADKKNANKNTGEAGEKSAGNEEDIRKTLQKQQERLARVSAN